MGSKPRATCTSRFVRGRRFDRNPLRRPADRAETIVLALLFVAFLVGARGASSPSGRPRAGSRAHAMAQRGELAQAASARRVAAVVLTTPAVPAVGSWDVASVTQARWTAPDGAVVTSGIPVPGGTAAGARLSVWTTRAGQPAAEPLNGSQVASLTLLGEAAGVTALAIVLALAGVLARWTLNRYRLAA